MHCEIHTPYAGAVILLSRSGKYAEKIDDTKGVGEAVNQRSDNTRTKTKENKHKRTNSDLQNTTRKTTNIRGYLCQ
jgi:ABC-type Fe3+-citrate transport system substrate-binding protein